MVITLLVITFVIAFLVSFVAARIFHKPLNAILHRLIPEDINKAWGRYLEFAIYVVGISNGVRIYELQQYITPQYVGTDNKEPVILVLNSERWALEIYSTIIGTLGGIAWMLLVFFVVALIAYVIVRIFEAKKHEH